MKTEKSILIAFVLNLVFSVFEFLGGIFTGSVAIVSDAIHDIGDAASIGASFFLEKKSKRQPDKTYTYGYARYSVLGSLLTTLILLVGSLLVIYHAVLRIIDPVEIRYDAMIVFAIFGVAVNLAAALFTRHGHSLNQKAVNLHMLEDILGWIVVLIGAIVMRFTDIAVIDPILSICTAAFILVNACKGLKEAVDLFLEKTPRDVDLEELTEHLTRVDGVQGVHHIHVWSMDGTSLYATMHIVTDKEPHAVKEAVREELAEHGIKHATLELEAPGEHCHEQHCQVERATVCGHHHHHHHHHHH